MKTLSTIFILLMMNIVTFGQYNNAIRFRINGNGYSDETIVRMLQGASPQFDSFCDAYKLFSINPNVPSIFTQSANNEEMSINTFQLLNKDSMVTVFVNIPVTGTYTIDIENIFPFEANYKISFSNLIDNTHYFISSDTTLSVQFNQGDSIAAFSFNISTPLSVNTVDESCAGLNNGSLNIINAGNDDWTYSVLSASGSEAENINAQSEQVNIDDLAPGNYTVISSWRGIIDSVEVSIAGGLQVVAAFQPDADTLLLSENNAVLNVSNTSLNASTYFWDFGNGLTATDENPVTEYDIAGEYTVTLIVTNGACADTSSAQITVINDTPTGISTYDANNTVKLTTLDNDNYQILSGLPVKNVAIYNINGQLVSNSGNNYFTLSNQPSGHYLVQIYTTDTTIRTFRIIKP